MRDGSSSITPLPDATGSQGLCATCDHVQGCLFSKAARRPMWHCDEFFSSTQATWQRRPQDPALPGPILAPESLGLCSDCGRQNRCALRHSGRTILECEEYA